MEGKQSLRALTVMLSCMLLAVVWCEEQQGSQLDQAEASQPQKRSVDPRGDDSDAYLPEYYTGSDDDMDKRGSLFRFGKRGSLSGDADPPYRVDKRGTLFRFGKRGSLFRFGKRGSLFRFGKRGSLFRFGKREDDGGVEDESEMYPVVFAGNPIPYPHLGR